MKIAAQRRVGPLRPTPLELICWFAAWLMAVALATSPAPPAASLAQPVRTIGVPHSPDLLAYRQHCIDRVLASDLGMTEESVVRKINQQCSTRRRIVTPPALLTCGRLFVGELTPIAKRVTGCIGS